MAIRKIRIGGRTVTIRSGKDLQSSPSARKSGSGGSGTRRTINTTKAPSGFSNTKYTAGGKTYYKGNTAETRGQIIIISSKFESPGTVRHGGGAVEQNITSPAKLDRFIKTGRVEKTTSRQEMVADLMRRQGYTILKTDKQGGITASKDGRQTVVSGSFTANLPMSAKLMNVQLARKLGKERKPYTVRPVTQTSRERMMSSLLQKQGYKVTEKQDRVIAEKGGRRIVMTRGIVSDIPRTARITNPVMLQRMVVRNFELKAIEAYYNKIKRIKPENRVIGKTYYVNVDGKKVGIVLTEDMANSKSKLAMSKAFPFVTLKRGIPFVSQKMIAIQKEFRESKKQIAEQRRIKEETSKLKHLVPSLHKKYQVKFFRADPQEAAAMAKFAAKATIQWATENPFEAAAEVGLMFAFVGAFGLAKTAVVKAAQLTRIPAIAKGTQIGLKGVGLTMVTAWATGRTMQIVQAINAEDAEATGRAITLFGAEALAFPLARKAAKTIPKLVARAGIIRVVPELSKTPKRVLTSIQKRRGILDADIKNGSPFQQAKIIGKKIPIIVHVGSKRFKLNFEVTRQLQGMGKGRLYYAIPNKYKLKYNLPAKPTPSQWAKIPARVRVAILASAQTHMYFSTSAQMYGFFAQAANVPNLLLLESTRIQKLPKQLMPLIKKAAAGKLSKNAKIKLTKQITQFMKLKGKGKAFPGTEALLGVTTELQVEIPEKSTIWLKPSALSRAAKLFKGIPIVGKALKAIPPIHSYVYITRTGQLATVQKAGTLKQVKVKGKSLKTLLKLIGNKKLHVISDKSTTIKKGKGLTGVVLKKAKVLAGKLKSRFIESNIYFKEEARLRRRISPIKLKRVVNTVIKKRFALTGSEAFNKLVKWYQQGATSDIDLISKSRTMKGAKKDAISLAKIINNLLPKTEKGQYAVKRIKKAFRIYHKTTGHEIIDVSPLKSGRTIIKTKRGLQIMSIEGLLKGAIEGVNNKHRAMGKRIKDLSKAKVLFKNLKAKKATKAKYSKQIKLGEARLRGIEITEKFAPKKEAELTKFKNAADKILNKELKLINKQAKKARTKADKLKLKLAKQLLAKEKLYHKRLLTQERKGKVSFREIVNADKSLRKTDAILRAQGMDKDFVNSQIKRNLLTKKHIKSLIKVQKAKLQARIAKVSAKEAKHLKKVFKSLGLIEKSYARPVKVKKVKLKGIKEKKRFLSKKQYQKEIRLIKSHYKQKKISKVEAEKEIRDLKRRVGARFKRAKWFRERILLPTRRPRVKPKVTRRVVVRRDTQRRPVRRGRPRRVIRRERVVRRERVERPRRPARRTTRGKRTTRRTPERRVVTRRRVVRRRVIPKTPVPKEKIKKKHIPKKKKIKKMPVWVTPIGVAYQTDVTSQLFGVEAKGKVAQALIVPKKRFVGLGGGRRPILKYKGKRITFKKLPK